MMKEGKIVYRPPERCFTRVNIEETDHGYKIYRKGAKQPFTFIPHSSIVSIDYIGE